jgi:hypothetical protein
MQGEIAPSFSAKAQFLRDLALAHAAEAMALPSNLTKCWLPSSEPRHRLIKI